MMVDIYLDHFLCLSFSFPEPIPSSMDNWGEGVVPACREESTIPIVNQSSPPPAIDAQKLDENDRVQQCFTSSSTRPFADVDAQPEQIDHFQQEETNTTHSTQEPSVPKHKPYNHNVLVIETQPPKVEKSRLIRSVAYCFFFLVARTIIEFIPSWTHSNDEYLIIYNTNYDHT